MFSRSFIKSPYQANQDIAERAHVSCQSVRRSAACSGEHNYTYTSTGFRVFRAAHDGNYTENLINDYQQVYEEGNPTLPYHAALTALHHKNASTAVTKFLSQTKTTLQLVHMHNTAAPAPAPTPVELDYARSQHLLDKMQFALPPHHPKRLVIIRGPGIGPIIFDPTQLPPERRFVKTCCNQMSSADTCCCHVGSSNESVRYVNACGECMNVCYYPRKNDYFNTAYRMWSEDSDREKDVPHSPKGDISDSEIFPTYGGFENEIANADQAKHSGFTYVWKDKNLQRRHETRQRRRHEKVLSGELPNYGLIVILAETNETRAINPHPIPGYDADMCRRNKARYEDIRTEVHAEAITKGTLAPPAAAASASAPVPRFNTAGLLSFQIRRLIQQEYRDQSIRDIQRPLSDASTIIAHAASRLQVTEISALKTYQRTRLTAFASFAALLAIRFSAERGYASFATILHHRMIQHILRRATGSIACAQQISSPYIKDVNPLGRLHRERNRECALRVEAERRFDTDNPGGFPLVVRSLSDRPCSTRGGPIQYHTAKYYAQKCLELIGNPDNATDTAAVARWSDLDAQVLRVRRGEVAAHEVFASPQHNSWIYMVHYTYIVAARQFLTAIERWRDVSDTAKSYAGPGNQCPTIWRDSRICKDSPAYVQCVQMVHEMYRFIYRAARIISPQYMAVFGFNQRYVNTIIQRTRYLAHNDGDETSALMFGFLMPAMMTPDVHLDILVEAHIFQHPVLYVKMSDSVFGPIKKQLRDMIPSRHTGTIDRTTLMNEPRIVRRA